MKKEERSTVLGKHRSKGTGVRQRTTPGKPRDDDFTQEWVCPMQRNKKNAKTANKYAYTNVNPGEICRFVTNSGALLCTRPSLTQ